MKQLILCDFDGTISTKDMGYALLDRFSSGGWETIDREYTEGRIGSKEAYSRISKLLKVEESDFFTFVRENSEIDPHFVSLYRYCRKNGIDCKIISDGLDAYIRAILEANHLLEIPFYANCSHFLKGERMEVSFPYFNEACGLCGTCKKKLLEIHRKEYGTILFVGNGFSDRCAAREADFVFAKDSLYPYCIDQDIPCHFFQDFHEILGDLRKRLRGIIFDLDGTLIEAYEAIYLGLKEVLLHFGKAVFPFSDLNKYLRADLEGTMAGLFTPDEAVRGIPIMRSKYEQVYLDKTHFMDGAGEVLAELHSRGILLGVASNKFGRFSRGALQRLSVSHYFKSVIGAGDVSRNKPFPDMIDAVLEGMQLPAGDAVFVGDTLTDIETGKRAGVDVYALPTGFDSKKELSNGKPRRVLRNLQELIQIIDHPFLVSSEVGSLPSS